MSENELTVLKGIIVSLLTAAGRIAIEKLIRQNESRKFVLLSDMRECIEAYDSLLANGDVERITVLKMSYRFSIEAFFRGEVPYRVDMLYQEKSVRNKVKEDAYEDILPDRHYVEMVKSLYREGPCIFLPEDIKGRTLLSGIYRSVGINYSEIYLVRKNPFSYVFVSFATSKDKFHRRDTDERIRLCVQKTNSILKTL